MATFQHLVRSLTHSYDLGDLSVWQQSFLNAEHEAQTLRHFDNKLAQRSGVCDRHSWKRI